MRMQYHESPAWNCRYGHGRLELQKHHFALRAVSIPGRPLGSGSNDVPQAREAVSGDDLYVAQLWRCTQCGYLELVDRE
jgi:hypothetical protein